MTVLETLLQQSEESLHSQAQSYIALLSSLHSQEFGELLVCAGTWEHAPVATVPAHGSLRPLFAAWAALAKQGAAHREVLGNCLVQQKNRRAKRALRVWCHHADGRRIGVCLLRRATQYFAHRWLHTVATRACHGRIAASSRRCCSALYRWRLRTARKAAAKQASTRAVQAYAALLLRQGLRALQAAQHDSLRPQHATAQAIASTLRRGLYSWHR
jgi:hypothetical protein